MKNKLRLKKLFLKEKFIYALALSLFMLTALNSYAATYYFSSSTGNDNYSMLEARNPATPWKSLTKLNSFFGNLSAGDSVLFKRGENFSGSVNVTKSGSVFAPIYLGAYGKGNNKPVINGSSTLSMWKPVKKGIYETPCETDGSTLLINGIQQAIGRYPNKGYLAYEAHNDNNSITDAQLTDQINWTGAEVVIRKNRWIIDKSTITGAAHGTISYEAGTKAAPTNGYGYFIQKSINTLDEFGEWYYDPARKSMMVYFGSRNPNAFNVKTNAAGNLVEVKRYNYVTFENIAFSGAGKSTFHIVQSKNITIKNCAIDLTANEAVLASYSPFITVVNTTINHSLSGGINLDAGCTNASIANNAIQNTGLIAGLGKSGSGTYEAITSFGDNALIEKNVIDSTGYNGIYFGGNSSVVKNNYITYFCLTKDDGAGIYIGDWSKTMNKEVNGNIVLHGIGNNGGTNSPVFEAEGIYIDDNTESVTIKGNTVSLCANNGIKVHNAKDINIVSNVVYNNGVQLRMEQDHYIATSTYIRNNRVKNNTFFSTTNRQPTAKFSTQQDDIAAFGQLDSNYYCRAKDQAANMVAITTRNGKGVNQNYDLNKWKSAYGKDQFSTDYQASVINNKDEILFEYNASNVAKTVTLKSSYVDVQNNVYNNKIKINPYSSVILVLNKRKIIGNGAQTAMLVNKRQHAFAMVASTYKAKAVISAGN